MYFSFHVCLKIFYEKNNYANQKKHLRLWWNEFKALQIELVNQPTQKIFSGNINNNNNLFSVPIL